MDVTQSARRRRSAWLAVAGAAVAGAIVAVALCWWLLPRPLLGPAEWALRATMPVHRLYARRLLAAADADHREAWALRRAGDEAGCLARLARCHARASAAERAFTVELSAAPDDRYIEALAVRARILVLFTAGAASSP